MAAGEFATGLGTGYCRANRNEKKKNRFAHRPAGVGVCRVPEVWRPVHRVDMNRVPPGLESRPGRAAKLEDVMPVELDPLSDKPYLSTHV